MTPLVSVEWLLKNLNNPDIVILDSSPESNVSGLIPEYKDIQIKGARSFNLKKSFSNKKSHLPNMLPDPETFAAECRKLGINNNSKIVVYDNLGIYTSPRVWWMFKTMGHRDIAVLNGGLTAWKKENLPCEPKSSSFGKIKQGDFIAQYNSEAVKNAAFILKNIEAKACTVIDARSEGRFYGKAPEPRKDLRSGHIPGSLNLPYKSVLKDGFYKPESELKEIFDSMNLETQPLVFSCGSGLTACIILLAMELVSDNKKSLYDGSWTEWGSEDKFPVELF